MFNFFRKKSDPSVACKQARSLIPQGKIEEALRLYEVILSENPRFALAYADRGTLYAMTKNFTKAIEDLSKAIELGYCYDSVFTTLATIHLELHDYQKALTYFSQAITLNPNNPLIYYNRSTVYSELGNKELALSDLRKCLEFGPDQASLSAINKRIDQVSSLA
jgi:tetratricopeptide (TPR) repeat protein